nr:histidine phosphatase family protein [Nakamurella lactea]
MTRHLYVARHGEADAFGEITDIGRRQAALLGRRLADIEFDAVWHSPLPRAVESTRELAPLLRPGTPAAEAAELIDHVPYVPTPAETPAGWIPFFDGYDATDAAAGNRIAERLVVRFGTAPEADAPDTHELLITHAYPIAWLVRHALDAPPARWLGLDSANTALTVIEYRPQLPPGLVMFNDQSHLPAELRWTGFGTRART